MEVLGTPTEAFMHKITSESARSYIKSLPPLKKKDLRQVFNAANPLAVELLGLMLEIDSDIRITAEQALAHAYLTQYSDPTDEPISAPYDQSIEDMDLPVEKWRGKYCNGCIKNYKYFLELVLEEVQSFVAPPAEEAS